MSKVKINNTVNNQLDLSLENDEIKYLVNCLNVIEVTTIQHIITIMNQYTFINNIRYNSEYDIDLSINEIIEMQEFADKLLQKILYWKKSSDAMNSINKLKEESKSINQKRKERFFKLIEVPDEFK